MRPSLQRRRRRPRGIFLKPGAVVRMGYENIGAMTNPVIEDQ
ncbi:MAG: hypothetical protein O7E53_04705 [Alphaproteobacteria bacterium]|nr:hypothetical protein [Alphaproteobacteria bacterium]